MKNSKKEITFADIVEITVQRLGFELTADRVSSNTGMSEQRQHECLKIGMKNMKLMNAVAELLRIRSVDKNEWNFRIAKSKINSPKTSQTVPPFFY